MRWSTGDRSNIEDARGRSGGGFGGGFGGGGFGGIHLGIGGVVLLALISWATGTNFLSLLSGGDPSIDTAAPSGQVASSPAEERQVDFVDAIMKDLQDTWAQLLGNRYEQTRVVLFRDSIQSACGFAQSATGPFYCPQDRRVYLDLGFYEELQNRFGAPGDFARAYVVAHEVGHHVQRLTGIESRTRAEQESNPGQANAISVRVELQADCFAGEWGHAASQPGRSAAGKVELESGDVEQG
jgi:predicted metalloprotease